MQTETQITPQTQQEAAPASELTTLNVSGHEPLQFSYNESAHLVQRIHSSANWFFWIAALSIINSLILMFSGNWSFLAGLGITQVIDGLAYSISNVAGSAAMVVAFVLNLFVAGGFVLLGLQGKKGQSWAFVTGLVLYALDGTIFLLVQGWLSIAFHLFVLYRIYQGLSASNQLKREQQERAVMS